MTVPVPASDGAPAPLHVAALSTSRPLIESRHSHAAQGLAIIESGAGGLIWTAEPGMGKSTLLSATLEAARALAPTPVVIRLSGHAPGTRGLVDVRGATLDQVQRQTGTSMPAQVRHPEAATPTALALQTTAFLRDAAAGTTVVLAIDDLDLLDESARYYLRALVDARACRVVALATASHAPCADQVPHDVDVHAIDPLGPLDALGLLTGEGVGPIAPMVVAELVHQVGGNTSALRQMARLLTREQLAGTSALPDPLPLVPAITAIARPGVDALDAHQRRALLLAAVAVVDRADVLATASGIPGEALTQGPLTGLLGFAAGRFRVLDARVRILAHSEASIAQRTEAHLALARAHREAGEEDIAAWHSALAHLDGDPDAVPHLLSLARRHLARGDTWWAHAVAREAHGHAPPALRAEAQEIAGVAAVLGGHVHDAVRWLAPLAGLPDDGVRSRTLWAYVVALAYSERRIPDDLLERARTAAAQADVNSEAGRALRRDTARALAIAASLHLERSNPAAAWGSLESAEALVAECSDRRDFTNLTRSWLGVYSQVSGAVVHQPGRWLADDEALSAMARAVSMMQAEECDAAARVLASAVGELAAVRHSRAWFAGRERAASPLVEAHLAVVQSLVELRAGDLTRASTTIADGMLHGPVGLVLAGLGGAISRRLDLLRNGAVSPLTTALVDTATFAGSRSGRLELLIDRALEAAMAQQWAEAATLLELAAAREAREPTVPLATPGLNTVEIWVRAGRPEQARKALARMREGHSPLPPATRAAVVARSELALAEPQDLDGALATVVATAANLTSAYERGRSEMCAAWALARAGRGDEARGHAMAAQDLFDEAGSHAWLPTLARDAVAIARTEPEPGAASHPDVPPWARELTGREHDVARLVVEGLSNREVARSLHLSVRTVEVHLGRVFRKLGVRSRMELAAAAHRSLAG